MCTKNFLFSFLFLLFFEYFFLIQKIRAFVAQKIRRYFAFFSKSLHAENLKKVYLSPDFLDAENLCPQIFKE